MLRELLGLLCIALLVAVYFPTRHARHQFPHIQIEEIKKFLHFDNITKYSYTICDYMGIINTVGDFLESLENKQSLENIHRGGYYTPTECNADFKVALIVPYRNRQQQLSIFLRYMHEFLRKQHVIYRIFVVNQTGPNWKPFNRGQLLNYGARLAKAMDFPCLILHDVDLLPLSSGNLYVCGRMPRHMSTNVDTFRFNLPYLSLVGGVLAIRTKQYTKVNGMTNRFLGWGGEDDDFYKRLVLNDLLPVRFPPDFGTYKMLKHSKAQPSAERFAQLEDFNKYYRIDGLSDLPQNFSVDLRPLYTLVSVF